MKKRAMILVPLFAMLVVLFLASCKGAAGNNGPTGSSGLSVMTFQDGVSPSNAYAGTTDTDLISGADASTNYGTLTIATAGSQSSGGGNFMLFRPLYRFDISTVVPSNITIQKAYLTITLTSYIAKTYNVYALTKVWTETQATWNVSATGINCTTTGGYYTTLEDSEASTSTTITFSLNPSLVQSWITTPSTNYGLLLKDTDETAGTFANINTRESSTAASRPKLTIYYSLP